MTFVPIIDFVTSAKKEGARVAMEVGLTDANDLFRNEYWLAQVGYRKDRNFLIFECEQDRGYGVDVRFGVGGKEEKGRSFHTFLRLYDSPAAYALGRCLPKDQSDMNDLLRLYAEALLKHRKEVFERTEKTITSMDRDLGEKNPPFNPTGRFCR